MHKAKTLNLQIKYNFKLKTNSTRSQNITKGPFINYVVQRGGKFFKTLGRKCVMEWVLTNASVVTSFMNGLKQVMAF